MITKLSYGILIVITLGVILNSVYVTNLSEKLYAISTNGDDAEIEEIKTKFDDIEKIYRKNEIFISLTVSHEDLTTIKDVLAEINGAILADDKESLIIAKSRFESAIQHLGRLSEFNIESIF